jgi:hypothetical protein
MFSFFALPDINVYKNDLYVNIIRISIVIVTVIQLDNGKMSFMQKKSKTAINQKIKVKETSSSGFRSHCTKF